VIAAEKQKENIMHLLSSEQKIRIKDALAKFDTTCELVPEAKW